VSLGTSVCIPSGARNARSASINTCQVEYAMTCSLYLPKLAVIDRVRILGKGMSAI
jgi:hypothetical protein